LALLLLIPFGAPGNCAAQGEALEVVCRGCGYRDRFMQGSSENEAARNVQQIIVVCERNSRIRNIAIAIDPNKPVQGEPLAGKQYGMGRSELLGINLPRFLVPGNTCPLFPISAYLEYNVCPIDGGSGIEILLVGQY
jgi:hypothetical protein